MSDTKKIRVVFTGGGSAGHVTPNIAVIDKLLAYQKCKYDHQQRRQEQRKDQHQRHKDQQHKGQQHQHRQTQDWEISYIGSRTGIERKLITKLAATRGTRGVNYFVISTGKLRRYFSWKNFIDPLKIFYGVMQAWWLCRKLKPDVIFSKGGFVSFPVVIAAWLHRVPVILHESDLTPGLANRLCHPFASKVCLTFAASTRYFSPQVRKKLVITGTPIRAALLAGDARCGLELCGFVPNKTTVLVIGGSLGADRINRVLRQALPALVTQQKMQIAHICGAGKVDAEFKGRYKEYKQFDYLHGELAHLFAAADIVVSRSGANSVYEILALKKPHIFIPLAKHSSRGDQIDNALHFAKLELSQVIMEENLTAKALIAKLDWLQQHKQEVSVKLAAFDVLPSVDLICEVIDSCVRR